MDRVHSVGSNPSLALTGCVASVKITYTDFPCKFYPAQCLTELGWNKNFLVKKHLWVSTAGVIFVTHQYSWFSASWTDGRLICPYPLWIQMRPYDLCWPMQWEPSGGRGGGGLHSWVGGLEASASSAMFVFDWLWQSEVLEMECPSGWRS